MIPLKLHSRFKTYLFCTSLVVILLAEVYPTLYSFIRLTKLRLLSQCIIPSLLFKQHEILRFNSATIVKRRIAENCIIPLTSGLPGNILRVLKLLHPHPAPRTPDTHTLTYTRIILFSAIFSREKKKSEQRPHH